MGRSSSKGGRSSSGGGGGKSGGSHSIASASSPPSRPASSVAHPSQQPAKSLATTPPPPAVAARTVAPPPAVKAQVPDSKSQAMGMMAKGAAIGAAGALIGSMILGGPKRPIETSDIICAAGGGIAGSGSYALFKYMRRSKVGLFGAALCGLAGSGTGLVYNEYRLQQLRTTWSTQVDNATGRTYYANNITGESSWDNPVK